MVLGGLFTLLTCLVGAIFAIPFFYLMLVVIYLGVTGQKTMLDQ